VAVVVVVQVEAVALVAAARVVAVARAAVAPVVVVPAAAVRAVVAARAAAAAGKAARVAVVDVEATAWVAVAVSPAAKSGSASPAAAEVGSSKLHKQQAVPQFCPRKAKLSGRPGSFGSFNSRQLEGCHFPLQLFCNLLRIIIRLKPHRIAYSHLHSSGRSIMLLRDLEGEQPINPHWNHRQI